MGLLGVYYGVIRGLSFFLAFTNKFHIFYNYFLVTIFYNLNNNNSKNNNLKALRPKPITTHIYPLIYIHSNNSMLQRTSSSQASAAQLLSLKAWKAFERGKPSSVESLRVWKALEREMIHGSRTFNLKNLG